MELTLNQISETLDYYFKDQVWKCVLPITDDDPIYDEYKNLIGGLEWSDSNDVPRPSVEEIENLWKELKSTGEYIKEFPGIPGIGDGLVFLGKTSQYAQALLKDSDWASLPDVNLENQSEWDEYRKILRNIRSNPKDDCIFPQKPKVIYRKEL